jgi:phosphoserine phosphatase RsbU/P
LPNVGIRDCVLLLYERESGSTLQTTRLVFTLKEGKRAAVDPEIRVPVNEPIHSFLFNDTEAHQYIIEPLYFEAEQLGIALFGRGTCPDGAYEALRAHFSGAIKGALLMRQVTEQALIVKRANEAIRHELDMGREIQQSFLPDQLPAVHGWEISASFMPARQVSGDFYDAFELGDGRMMFVIADVSGKDVSAALIMALMRTLIRATAEKTPGTAIDPLDAVEITNTYLLQHHQGNINRCMFVTLFLAILDTARNCIAYINAGHNPPAVIDKNGKIKQWLKPTGPAVGMLLDTKFKQAESLIEPGDTLFMYTDGVTEARNSSGDLFTNDRLKDLLGVHAKTADELIRSIEKALSDHHHGSAPYDDITMLAVRKSDA